MANCKGQAYSLNFELNFELPKTKFQKFQEFHLANPQVYESLEKLTWRLVKMGQKRIGIAYLFEILRYEHFLETKDPNSDLKLNNNYRSHYSRLLISNNPHLADFIEIREIRSL